MFNQFSTQILERLHGKKLPVVFQETTGVSERTWRNRIKNGWNPGSEELEKLTGQMAVCATEIIKAKGGWTENEVQDIFFRSPSRRAGIGLPTADLIFWFSPGFGKGYLESIAVASQFDLYCSAFSDAVKACDTNAARKVLLDCLEWLMSFCASDAEEDEDVQELREKLLAAEGLGGLLESAKPLVDQLLFLILSVWDVEFCSHYTGGKIEPFPLFKLVMPCLSPTIELESGSNRFLRDGKPPKRGVFEKSTARLLDFLAVLSCWRRNRVPPDKLPAVKEMAAWFKEDPGRITSWRDETTLFTYSHFLSVWQSACVPDKRGRCPEAPAPMLVVAHLLSPLLVREKGKVTQWIVCGDGYERWWKRILDRLTAKGLKFGSTPWPKCLTDQSVGNRLLESWLSSQSSGRSSQPLDSQ
ncbi:hypothetical protein [Zoogloea dura]|uniref:Uncharacterized protein n=1 Tax=Zoogloea dura TaxID=2728840 RepID=A0A848G3E2_9RHOO|nr:hypothetical protein [Zoogloea dura]NML26737.1 hypothetical protein [Zoogloea dura]